MSALDGPTPDQEPEPGVGPREDPGFADAPEAMEQEGDSDLVMNELIAQQIRPAPYDAGLVDRAVKRRPRRV
jgi:hypothetical protein